MGLPVLMWLMYASAASVCTATTDVGDRVLTMVVKGSLVMPDCTDDGSKYIPPFRVGNCCFKENRLVLSKSMSVGERYSVTLTRPP